MVEPLKDYGQKLSRQGIGITPFIQDEFKNVRTNVTATNGVFNKKIDESGQIEWESPIIFNDYSLPFFPIDVLPKWMGDFCKDVSESIKAPIDLCGCMCLSALSLAVVKKYKVQVKEGYTEHLNIWTLVLLEASNSKSPVVAEMVAPIRVYVKRKQELERLEIAQAKELYDTKKRQLESLKNIASKPQGDSKDKRDYLTEIKQLAVELEGEKIPVQTQMLINDITTEQLITKSYEQKGNRIGAITGEGRIVFDNWTKYGNGGLNINFYLSAYSNEYYTVDRRERHEIIEEPALTMGLATQKDVLTDIDKKLLNKLIGSGLLSRFLYSFPKSLIGERDFTYDYEIPATTKGQYCFNLSELLAVEIPNECYIFTLSSKGKASFLKYRQQLEQDLKEGGSLSSHHSWGGKAHGQMIRLAGLLHVAENVKSHRPWEIEISGETIQRAIILMNYFKCHMLAVFDLIGAVAEEVPAKKILKYIQELKKDIIDRRDLQQHFKNTDGLKGKKDLDTAINLLEEWGYIIKEPVKDNGAGRKKVRFRINPLSQNSQNPQNAIKVDNTRNSGFETVSPIHPQSIPNIENNNPNNVMAVKRGCNGDVMGIEENKNKTSNDKGLKNIGDNGDFGLKGENEKTDAQEDFNLLEGEI